MYPDVARISVLYPLYSGDKGQTFVEDARSAVVWMKTPTSTFVSLSGLDEGNGIYFTRGVILCAGSHSR